MDMHGIFVFSLFVSWSLFCFIFAEEVLLYLHQGGGYAITAVCLSFCLRAGWLQTLSADFIETM